MSSRHGILSLSLQGVKIGRDICVEQKPELSPDDLNLLTEADLVELLPIVQAEAVNTTEIGSPQKQHES